MATVVDGAIPPHLRLGVCLEIYLPEAVAGDLAGRFVIANYMTAKEQYRAARGVWLTTNGFDPEDWISWPVIARWIDDDGNEQVTRFAEGRPWSFARAMRDYPDYLAKRLQRSGLPTDWVPVPVTTRKR